jgi:hypothetical protein
MPAVLLHGRNGNDYGQLVHDRLYLRPVQLS